MAERKMPKKVKPSVEEAEEIIDETFEEPVKVEKIGVVTNCRRLNLRKRPDKTSGIIKELDAGTEVTVVDDKVDGWFEVTTKYGDGFVMKDFIMLK